jgi:uncharacterized membrane protein
MGLVSPPQEGPAFERVLFFSDAVFAIAITLLVLPLADEHIRRHDVGGQIVDLIPQMLTFGLSFIVIGLFWVSHHASFQYIKAFDPLLLTLNMAFLLCIAFMPFPTVVLAAEGSDRAAVALYAGAVAVTGAVSCAMWWYASHQRRLLLTAETTPELILALRLDRLVTPAVFALAIPIAFASAALGKYTFILVIPASRLAAHTARRRAAQRLKPRAGQP